MNDMTAIVKRYAVYSAVIILILLGASLFTAEPSFLLGLAFGTSFSFMSLLSTYFQVKRLGQSTQDRKFRFSLGTIGRILIALAAVAVAQQFPQFFDLTGVLIGLGVTYVILLIEPLFHLKDTA